MRITTACKQIMNEPHVPVLEKETKNVASGSLRDVEAEFAFSIAARRPGSIWTIVGCVSDRLDIEYKVKSKLMPNRRLLNFSDGYQQSLVSL
jgi:hypothetical protein